MTNDITIRFARPEDAHGLAEIYKYYVLNTAVTYEYAPPSAEDFARRIGRTLEKYPYLLAEQNGEPVGYAYAGTFIARAAADWNAEVSIYLRSDRRGAGIGRRLYDALENILREQGIVNAAAAIAAPGDHEDEYLTRGSLDFHSRMGYVTVGTFRKNGHKFGRWYDLVWMEKQLNPPLSYQPPFKPIGEVRGLITEKYGIR